MECYTYDKLIQMDQTELDDAENDVRERLYKIQEKRHHQIGRILFFQNEALRVVVKDNKEVSGLPARMIC